jgi:beta-lactam-binding protein with PASTA domain
MYTTHTHISNGDDGGIASRVLVPDLLGKSLDEAKGTAENQGLHVAKNPTSGYNTQYGEGLIYQQSPAAGDYAAPGARITVHISKGDPPEPTVPGADPQTTGQ